MSLWWTIIPWLIGLLLSLAGWAIAAFDEDTDHAPVVGMSCIIIASYAFIFGAFWLGQRQWAQYEMLSACVNTDDIAKNREVECKPDITLVVKDGWVSEVKFADHQPKEAASK